MWLQNAILVHWFNQQSVAWVVCEFRRLLLVFCFDLKPLKYKYSLNASKLSKRMPRLTFSRSSMATKLVNWVTIEWRMLVSMMYSLRLHFISYIEMETRKKTAGAQRSQLQTCPQRSQLQTCPQQSQLQTCPQRSQLQTCPHTTKHVRSNRFGREKKKVRMSSYNISGPWPEHNVKSLQVLGTLAEMLFHKDLEWRDMQI